MHLPLALSCVSSIVGPIYPVGLMLFSIIFSSPVQRSESYSDTPGVSVSVSMKMLKFLVQIISLLMFLSTTLFFTDYNIQKHILLKIIWIRLHCNAL